jgi:hypothetical protein
MRTMPTTFPELVEGPTHPPRVPSSARRTLQGARGEEKYASRDRPRIHPLVLTSLTEASHG